MSNTGTIKNLSNPSNLELAPLAMRYTYCDLTDFKVSYRAIHWYIALIVCAFGFVMNTANIVVLIKMNSKITSANIVLAGLALANNVVNTEYIPYALGTLIFRTGPNENVLTYMWASYVLMHAHISQVFYTISIWMTMLLALWHYISVAHPLRSRLWCTRKRAFQALAAIYITASLACIPFYLSFAINEMTLQVRDDGKLYLLDSFKEHHNETITVYYVGLSVLAEGHDSPLAEINLWTHGIVNKLVPCLIITILSVLLICALRAASMQRGHLRVHIPSSSSVPSTHNSPFIAVNNRRQHIFPHRPITRPQRETEIRIIRTSLEEDQERMTWILLVILFLFLITEFPQGILALLSWILGDVFNHECYHQLGDLFDIFSLTKSSINFVLYCTMSRKFRANFYRIFFSRWREFRTSSFSMFSRNLPAPSDENSNQPGVVTTPLIAPMDQHQLYATSTV